MCKGIEELMQMRKAEGKAEGILLTLVQLVQDGLLELPVAAQRANLSKEDFAALLVNESSEETYVN